MTVKDFLDATTEYQSFILTIYDYGCNKKLFCGWLCDTYDVDGLEYANKKVAAVKFGNEWVQLILAIGEV